MWSIITSLAGTALGALDASSSRMKYLLIGTVVGALCGSCAVFYWHGLVIKSRQADQLKITAAAQAALIEEQQNAQKRIADALSKRDEALKAVADSRVAGSAVAVRLRSAADADAKQAKRASNSCKRYINQLATCRRLLSEGADLAVEGSGLAEWISLDKDTIVKALIAPKTAPKN